MRLERFEELSTKYGDLAIAVIGDFCLDRYLEIDPALEEVSIETGLPVHNVSAVRAQPGGAGTVVNNLAALGVKRILCAGFCGEDGHGYELKKALARVKAVDLSYFLETSQRSTFTYCKPLLLSPGRSPMELNRLDFKNWTPTPANLEEEMILRVRRAVEAADAVIILDQVDRPETGVVTRGVLNELGALQRKRPECLMLADSRSGLKRFPKLTFKMNAAELRELAGAKSELTLAQAKVAAKELARRNGRSVFVTMAGQGIVGASAFGECEHLGALPLRGQIDVVGAGDAVSANLVCAIAAGATVTEALEAANTAASVVVHKIGTTGTASLQEMRAFIG